MFARRGAAACILVLGFAGVAMLLTSRSQEQRAELVQATAQRLNEAAAALGFGVKHVRYAGLHYTPHSAAKSALDLDAGTSQLAFDTQAAKARIERLPWVERATLQRILPDTIAVTVVERRPVAIWRQPGIDMLIDASGRALAAIRGGSETGLPVLLGAGAGDAAQALLQLLAEHIAIGERVVEAVRIEDRRWNLHLSNGALVQLPADGMAAALAWLAVQPRLLDSDLDAIDLRVAGQMVVRGAVSSGPAAATVEPHQHAEPRLAATSGNRGPQ